MILPFRDFQGDSNGEDFLWNLFRDELPSEYISFHGYDIGIRRTDIIMLVPDKGVLIIENKSFKAKSVARVPDNTIILRYNKPSVYSPMKQAEKYKDTMINVLLAPNGIDDVMIACAVSYPYISEQEFTEKNLEKISLRDVTFLKEDLLNQQTIVHRIDAIFHRYYDEISHINISKGGFHLVKMDQVANLISPNYKNEAPQNEEKPNRNDRNADKDMIRKPDYSLLIISRDGKAFSGEKTEELIRKWKSGTKLFLYTGNHDAHKKLLQAFGEEIRKCDLPEDGFKIRHNSSFRLETGVFPDAQIEQDELVIRNGEGFEDSDAVLQLLDQYTSFNYGQYKMEHAPAVDVKVTAGAGTGKTHTMVSRISFLIWKDDVEPEDFPHYLIMITFTNKSADEMKHRLFQYYLNMYMLTRQPEYFRYLEAVEDVQISTIHSLCKAIIGKYGTKLGLGTDFQISTGNFRRKEILREELDHWLEQQETGLQIKMKNYFLQKRLEDFIDKIDNKNVDLISSFESLDFGRGPHCMPRSLLEVVQRTQQRLDDEMTAENNVCLKSIIRKLGQLCDLLTEADFPAERSIQYLFVDEFQDTDNVQIELIQRFQRIAHFRWFVVGDTKQCIYRFRGADDEAFARLTRNHPCYEVALKKNYRTDVSLLEEMNRCFASWNAPGYLNYSGDEVLTGVKVDPVDLPLEMIPCGKEPDEQTFVSIIRDAIARAEQAGTDEKAAILVRNNYQIDQVLALCRKHEISVGTEVGGRLFQSDPTIDLYKLLLALRYSNEPEYLFNLYTTSYVRGALPKKELVGRSRRELAEYFETHCGIPDWAEYKKEIRVQPVMYVLQKIIQRCHPWDRFAEIMNMPGKEQKLRNYYMRNLDQVFEKLMHVANTDYLTINKITDYLEIMIATRQEADERESFEDLDGEERLICTTVHKAKGMEFDTVILPYNSLCITNTIDKGNVDVVFDPPKVAYRISDKEDSMEQSWNKSNAFVNDYYEGFKQGENRSRACEETRILYVAMTRAKRKLVCMIPKSNGKNVTWGKLIKGGLE